MAKVKASKLSFGDIKTLYDQLSNSDEFVARNTLQDSLEQIYSMVWDDQPTDLFVKPTMSPDGHNAVNAVQRILSTEFAHINIPSKGETEEDKKAADNIEKGLATMLKRSDIQRNTSLTAEMVKSLTIFSQCAIKIVDLRMARVLRGSKSALSEFPQHLTPIVWKSLLPQSVYYQNADFGLSTVVEVTSRSVSELRQAWRGMVDGLKDMPGTTMLNTYEYWDYDPIDETGTHCVWCEELKEPILNPSLHGLNFIPYVIRSCSASSFLKEAVAHYASMLYPLLQGKLWHRKNLMMTVMATLIQLYTNPKWVTHTIDGKPVPVSFNLADGNVSMRVNETVEPLARQLLPPELLTFLQLISQDIQKSTIPDIITGAAPGGATAGIAISILSDSGKLAIYPINQAADIALTDALSIALGWIEHGAYPVKLDDDLEISDEDAKKYRRRVTASLVAQMPKDKLSIATMYNQMIQGGWGDPENALNEMGYSNAQERLDAALRWRFMQEHVKELAEGRAGDFAATRNKEKPGIPSSVLPPEMQAGMQNPSMPTPEEVRAMEERQAMEQMAQQQSVQQSPQGVPPEQGG